MTKAMGHPSRLPMRLTTLSKESMAVAATTARARTSQVVRTLRFNKNESLFLIHLYLL